MPMWSLQILPVKGIIAVEVGLGVSTPEVVKSLKETECLCTLHFFHAEANVGTLTGEESVIITVLIAAKSVRKVE